MPELIFLPISALTGRGWPLSLHDNNSFTAHSDQLWLSPKEVDGNRGLRWGLVCPSGHMASLVFHTPLRIELLAAKSVQKARVSRADCQTLVLFWTSDTEIEIVFTREQRLNNKNTYTVRSGVLDYNHTLFKSLGSARFVMSRQGCIHFDKFCKTKILHVLANLNF